VDPFLGLNLLREVEINVIFLLFDVLLEQVRLLANGFWAGRELLLEVVYFPSQLGNNLRVF